MEITVTREMIDEAILNVNSKLSNGKQKEKVYGVNSQEDIYYINNIVGELGELAFQKSIINSGYELGVEAHLFEPFMNSDVCDFYASKTAKTIDVKTVYKDNGDNLIISEDLANWRPVHTYVLVKLLPERKSNHTLESIYGINKAEIVGSRAFSTIKQYDKPRSMYSKQIYFIKKEILTPINKLFGFHFYKNGEEKYRYYSKGKLELHLASIEEGSVCEYDNLDINNLAEMYKGSNKPIGHYNFIPMFIKDNNKLISFSILNGKFNTSLFLKALLEAEVLAKKLQYVLVIPAYIENYIPEKDKVTLINIIDNMKCGVEYMGK